MEVMINRHIASISIDNAQADFTLSAKECPFQAFVSPSESSICDDNVFMGEDVTTEELLYRDNFEKVLVLRNVAAMLLQSWWRQRKQHLEARQNAQSFRRMRKIFRLWMQLMHQTCSRNIINSVVNSVHHHAALRNNASSIVARCWRRRLLATKKQSERVAAVQLLSNAYSHYISHRGASLIIQRRWRSVLYCRSTKLLQASLSVILAQNTRFTYWSSASALSAALDALLKRRVFSATVCSASTIQLFFRRRRSALIVQSVYRTIIAQRSAFVKFRSVASLQLAFGSFLAHRKVLELSSSSILIQSVMHNVQPRKRLNLVVSKTLVLQRVFKKVHRRNKFRKVILDVCELCRKKKSRFATLIQAAWRGHRLRRLVGGPIRKLSSCAKIIQAIWRRYRARRQLLRMRKKAEISSRREVLLAKVQSLPQSGDFQLQSLRERYSQRLAEIEFTDHQGDDLTEPEILASTTAPSSVLTLLDAKRARLARIRAQLNSIRVNNATTTIGAVETEVVKVPKSVTWVDDRGVPLLDSCNPKHVPSSASKPLRSCIKQPTTVPSRSCAQRIGSVLSTTFGKARRRKVASEIENAIAPNVSSAARSTPNRKGSARRVRIA